MKLDEDYKKVMDKLQVNFGWSNIDVLPENHQDLLNDTIMAVKNLTIQRVINLVCPKCGNTGRCEPRTLSDPDGQESDCGQTCLQLSVKHEN